MYFGSSSIASCSGTYNEFLIGLILSPTHWYICYYFLHRLLLFLFVVCAAFDFVRHLVGRKLILGFATVAMAMDKCGVVLFAVPDSVGLVPWLLSTPAISSSACTVTATC